MTGTSVEAGEYRNALGATLHVTGPWLTAGSRVKSLGGIYQAEDRDELFGTTQYLVTKESLVSCGYVLVGDSETPIPEIGESDAH